MKKAPFVNTAVFVLFFGLALVEALSEGNWLEAVLFIGLGILFLRADFANK